MNQRNGSDLEISRTNSALTSSNSRIKPKTYRLCVPNLVPKISTLGHSWASRILYFALCRSKNNFHSHLMNMSEYFKLPEFNPDLLDTAMVKSYLRSMKQEYTSYWQNILQHYILKNLNFIDLLKPIIPPLVT